MRHGFLARIFTIRHYMHSSLLRIFICQATYYPGLCEPISQGGLGFDYYVNLSASEMWSSFLQNVPDQEWNMNKVVLYHLRTCLMDLNHLEGFPFIKERELHCADC